MIYNGKQVGHNGLEETAYIKQGVGLHIEMITVNGWCEGGKEGGGSGKEGAGECLVNGGDGERFLSKLSQTFS